jgi:hypothetical protein
MIFQDDFYKTSPQYETGCGNTALPWEIIYVEIANPVEHFAVAQVVFVPQRSTNALLNNLKSFAYLIFFEITGSPCYPWICYLGF